MEKIDYRKKLKHLYQPSAKEIVIVNVPKMNFLMVDGEGDPNTSQSYVEAIEALFAVAYTLKFMIKKGPRAIDYGVMPPEGLWWTDDMSTFSMKDKSNWKWTMMIMQPGVVTKTLVAKAIAEVQKKKDPAALGKVRFQFVKSLFAAVLGYEARMNSHPTGGSAVFRRQRSPGD